MFEKDVIDLLDSPVSGNYPPGTAALVILTIGSEGLTFCPLPTSEKVWEALEAKLLNPSFVGLVRYEEKTGKFLGVSFDNHAGHPVEFLTEFGNVIARAFAVWSANMPKGKQ